MRDSTTARRFVVLLVEDNPGDVRLAKEALLEGGVPKEIHVAEDGVEALEFLERRKQKPGARLPDVILLDLNLPRKSGHEVLAEIRADAVLRHTPVIIFSSSAAQPDVEQAYELHANCYVTKPAGFAELMDTIKRIETFWLRVVTLPPSSGL